MTLHESKFAEIAAPLAMAVRRQPFQQHCWHMHHFLVTAALQICVPRVDRSHAKPRSDLSALGNINFSNVERPRWRPKPAIRWQRTRSGCVRLADTCCSRTSFPWRRRRCRRRVKQNLFRLVSKGVSPFLSALGFTPWRVFLPLGWPPCPGWYHQAFLYRPAYQLWS